MKKLITITLVLFALVVNAQSSWPKWTVSQDTTDEPIWDGGTIILKTKTLVTSSGEVFLNLSDTLVNHISYDTTIMLGLGMYESIYSNSWEDGMVIKLVPTKKIRIQKFEYEDWPTNEWYEVYQYLQKTHTKTGWLTPIYEWQRIDLREYKEIMFIEKPK
jgi:hypothetical protein